MIEDTMRSNLKLIAKAYAKATGRSIGSVSREIYGQSAFLDAFFAGDQTVSISKMDEMLRKFAAAWPADQKWPLTRAVFMKPSPKTPGNLSPKNSAAA